MSTATPSVKPPYAIVLNGPKTCSGGSSSGRPSFMDPLWEQCWIRERLSHRPTCTLLPSCNHNNFDPIHFFSSQSWARHLCKMTLYLRTLLGLPGSAPDPRRVCIVPVSVHIPALQPENRITSYNVCYTKLLRCIHAINPIQFLEEFAS